MPDSLSVAGVVLAAGLSRRFGAANKLVAPLRSKPVVRHTVEAYLAAGLAPVVVVVGHQAPDVIAALERLPVVVVHNPEFTCGQSTSLIHGVRALPPHVAAAVLGVGDQPLLDPGIILDLIALQRKTGAPVVVPRYAGTRGNPVLFVRSLFPELLEVEGDNGGRPVIDRHQDHIAWLDVTIRNAGADVDTPDDLVSLT